MVLVVIAVSCGLLAMHALGALSHHGAGSNVSSHAAADTTALVAPHPTTLVAPHTASLESGGAGVHGGATSTSGNVLEMRGCTDACEVGSVVGICLAVLSGLYLLARLARRQRPVANNPLEIWRPLLRPHHPRAFASGPQLLNLLCVSRT
jgi:hypothetical protein